MLKLEPRSVLNPDLSCAVLSEDVVFEKVTHTASPNPPTTVIYYHGLTVEIDDDVQIDWRLGKQRAALSSLWKPSSSCLLSHRQIVIS